MANTDTAMQASNISDDQKEMLPPSARLDPMRRQEMLDEGWDLDAFDALFADDREQGDDQTPLQVPMNLFRDGFSISAIHPLFGYAVELWLHNTGWEPDQVLLRPRDALRLAELIETVVQRKSRMTIPKSMTTDFGSTLKIHQRLHGDIAINSDGTRVNLDKKTALRVVAELRDAAIAHIPKESVTLAA